MLQFFYHSTYFCYIFSPVQALLAIVLQLPPETHEDCVTALLKHWTTSYPFKLGEAFSCHSSLQTTLYVKQNCTVSYDAIVTSSMSICRSSHPSTTYILNQLTTILQTSNQVVHESK